MVVDEAVDVDLFGKIVFFLCTVGKIQEIVPLVMKK